MRPRRRAAPVGKRARMAGFRVFDYAHRNEEAITRMRCTRCRTAIAYAMNRRRQSSNAPARDANSPQGKSGQAASVLSRLIALRVVAAETRRSLLAPVSAPVAGRRRAAGADALPPKITRDGLRSKFVTARSKVASAPRASVIRPSRCFKRLLVDVVGQRLERLQRLGNLARAWLVAGAGQSLDTRHRLVDGWQECGRCAPNCSSASR